MICYAVIDTNVLVSSLLTSHNTAATVQVLERMFYGEIIPVFSEEILDEYRNVLSRPKFNFSPKSVADLINFIENNGERLSPESADEILPDMKDLPFYEVVMEKRKDDDAYLVTGNLKHFPIKPSIVSPKEMLDIIVNDDC